VRIGFAPSGRRDAATAVTLARRAEDAGFAEVWVSEDYLERGAFTLAGGIAAATSEVGIGLGVVNPWTRHVAVTAMECAALDELSGGRLTIGLGASNRAWMRNQLGIAFERPIATLVDYCDALRTLLAGERLRRRVGALDLDAALAFTPPRRLPVFLGVKGPLALERGAPVADGIMLSVLSSPEYVAWVRQTYAPRSLTAYVMFSRHDDPATARARIASRTGQFLGVHGPSPITAVPGLPAELARQFQERLRAGRDAADLVTDRIAAMFTVAGDDADCVAAFERFAGTGLDSLVVLDDGVYDAAQVVGDVAAIAGRAGLVSG
jgi:5,10-methylenetetrahydromethanopterin reductase